MVKNVNDSGLVLRGLAAATKVPSNYLSDDSLGLSHLDSFDTDSLGCFEDEFIASLEREIQKSLQNFAVGLVDNERRDSVEDEDEFVSMSSAMPSSSTSPSTSSELSDDLSEDVDMIERR